MRLGLKLTILTFVTGVIALMAMVAFSHFQDRDAILEQNLNVLQEAAHQRADHVEAFLKNESVVTRTLAHSPLLLELLQKDNQPFEGMDDQSRSEAIKDLNSRWKSSSPVLSSCFQMAPRKRIFNLLQKSPRCHFP